MTPSSSRGIPPAGPLQSSTRNASRPSSPAAPAAGAGGQPAMKRAAEASLNGPRGSMAKLPAARSLRAPRPRLPRGSLGRDFPLFPLALVALPGELVPLHIFEERYKTMMARCLEEESEFGIVWLSDDGLRPVGCACEIAEVLERMPDGRLNLVARGTRPFRIAARQDELAYPAGTVEFLADDDEVADEDAAQAAHRAYADLVEQATDRTPDPDEIAAMTAYDMAAT